MKEALISPTETVYKYDGSVLGLRVAEVSNQPFEIASPLFWISCADDVVAGRFYYDPATYAIYPIPVEPSIETVSASAKL